MPRFFMDYRQEGELFPDVGGIEFASAEDAYVEAFRSMQDMWSELLKERRDPRRCAFEVRDADRQLLFHLPFAEAVENCHRQAGAPDVSKTYRMACATSAQARKAAGEFQEELRSLRDALAQSRALILQSI